MIPRELDFSHHPAFRPLIAAVCCCVTASVAGAPDAPDFDRALQTLRSVGPEGHGNAAAARAWAEVVAKARAADVPLLLARLDPANPLAENWIRGAIDAIAERELARGGTLPAARLEEFVRNESRPPRARRLAFEWLSRIDPTARERLVPGMLNDPGVEFRRAAVEHALERAAAAGLQDDAAIAAYRRLLDAARDDDQVGRIRKQLRELGVEVDLQRHFGYVTEWHLVGPFDNEGERGLETAYPPEGELRLDAAYDGKPGEVKWTPHRTTDEHGKVDLNRALGRAKGVLAYAHSEFWSPAARDAEIRLSTVNAWKLWLNGELLYTRNEYHHGTQFDHYRVEAKLKPGKNAILLKVCQNELREKYADPWRFQLRVCDATGTAILSAPGPSSGGESGTGQRDKAGASERGGE